MSVRLLVRHDMGCRYARASDDLAVDDQGNITTGQILPGHSDAARRLSDTYNLHKAAGAIPGWWIAVSLATAESDGDAYPDKASAVWHQKHRESWFAFIRITPASMSICEAESQLRWHRQQAALKLNDRDYKRGGMDMIPRLTTEGARHQLLAARQVIHQPIAFGYAS